MRVLLVDDHEIARDGAKMQLERLEEGLGVDEAGTVAQAIELAQTRLYDLVLLDLLLPDSRGLETLTRFLGETPKSRVVVLSGTTEPRVVVEAIELGAVGFLPKRASRAEIVEALRRVLRGEPYVPNEALTSLIGERPVSSISERLTPRQLEVLGGAISGKPNKVIAEELNLSAHTVKAHLSAAMRVIGARNRTEAVFKTAALGIPVFSRKSPEV